MGSSFVKIDKMMHYFTYYIILNRDKKHCLQFFVKELAIYLYIE